MKKVFNSGSAAETEDLGRALAGELDRRSIKRAYIALDGEMGSGKTAFTRGFASFFGYRGIKSPTYSVVNEYKGGKLPIFHFDLYRLTDEEDLYSTGYDDYFGRDGYMICEWSGRIPGAKPEGAISVLIEKTDSECGRRITVDADFSDGGTEDEDTCI